MASHAVYRLLTLVVMRLPAISGAGKVPPQVAPVNIPNPYLPCSQARSSCCRDELARQLQEHRHDVDGEQLVEREVGEEAVVLVGEQHDSGQHNGRYQDLEDLQREGQHHQHREYYHALLVPVHAERQDSAIDELHDRTGRYLHQEGYQEDAPVGNRDGGVGHCVELICIQQYKTSYSKCNRKAQARTGGCDHIRLVLGARIGGNDPQFGISDFGACDMSATSDNFLDVPPRGAQPTRGYRIQNNTARVISMNVCSKLLADARHPPKWLRSVKRAGGYLKEGQPVRVRQAGKAQPIQYVKIPRVSLCVVSYQEMCRQSKTNEYARWAEAVAILINRAQA
ncbi:hypothetical protein SS50377_28375 [Spironucleus salmonicida]|uniref:Uncharacterized protein n=1 Tax=Spironucleus salmonicida TaxID=348837 RepID=V6M0K2_9EUKA|nr:hypothetical protein SS50377_28375 [Spironucleus salmonicida]|eukprot:EST49576.1 Hypothetical protein SS50377_10078 [Spironucleus salmonicida]